MLEVLHYTKPFRLNTRCRLCGGSLGTVHDFGALPLANALTTTRETAIESPRHELRLLHCSECLLGQLSIVVPPEILYSGYAYRSSVSETFRRHCAEFARKLAMPNNALCLDIGGNDGALMRELVANAAMRRGWIDGVVVDVTDATPDPEDRFSRWSAFWSRATAEEFREKRGLADLVTAQNVVGHVDDVLGFFRSVRRVLAPNGRFVVEVPGWAELVTHCAYDTIYHEHVSYWSLTAMERAGVWAGFELHEIEFFPAIHCGTLRFTFRPEGSEPPREKNAVHAIDLRKRAERGLLVPQNLRHFSRRIGLELDDLNKLLDSGGDFVGITASAKAVTILNLLRADCVEKIVHLVDDAESKQGRHVPGVGLSVLPFASENLRENALILSRNLVPSLTERLANMGYKGVVCRV